MIAGRTPATRRCGSTCKLAHSHQESQRGPHGGYIVGATGDWSDFSTQFVEMTESILVTAQVAYIYPRLAELAELRGDPAFAAELREDAAEQQAIVDREWVGKGWYTRGYSGERPDRRRRDLRRAAAVGAARRRRRRASRRARSWPTSAAS